MSGRLLILSPTTSPLATGYAQKLLERARISIPELDFKFQVANSMSKQHLSSFIGDTLLEGALLDPICGKGLSVFQCTDGMSPLRAIIELQTAVMRRCWPKQCLLPDDKTLFDPVRAEYEQTVDGNDFSLAVLGPLLVYTNWDNNTPLSRPQMLEASIYALHPEENVANLIMRGTFEGNIPIVT